jgi:Sec-independent protein translocase protein TatA
MPFFIFLLVCFFTFGTSASAETLEERIQTLEKAIRKQQETIQQQQKTLEELKEQSQKEKALEKTAAPEAAPRDYRQDDRSRGIYVKSASPVTPYSVTQQTSPSLMNPAIGVTLDTFYYDSSFSKEEVEGRSIPGYTHSAETFRKGFNLRSAEISRLPIVEE